MTGNDQHEATQPVIIENAATATFECTYGRGCDGICCRNGRPPVTQTESARINANIEKFLPELRPEARVLVEAQGYLSRRGLPDQPMLRVIGGWCVFFNKGCILHRIGAIEGDKYRYKPLPCSLFPIAKDAKDRWQVRQKGYQREVWDLFCLDPRATTVSAVDALQEEIALIRKVEAVASEGGIKK
jgi:Fe-S-cluster containining protein